MPAITKRNCHKYPWLLIIFELSKFCFLINTNAIIFKKKTLLSLWISFGKAVVSALVKI